MRVLSAGRLRNERGAVVPIVVLSLIAIFGMVVLAVDVGGLMAKRRTMVNTNDSAALAAARAYAIQEGGALCGGNDGPAGAAADSLAVSNAGSEVQTATNVFEPNCTEQTVHVEYEILQDLFFAPVLGFDDTTEVVAAATAQWGESLGGNPMPVELDPNLTNDCVFVDPETKQIVKPPGPCPDGFWFDNQDLTNSGWGLMNLNSWGVEADENCNNRGGSDQLGEWIMQAGVPNVRLTEIPTYVCTSDGALSPNWDTDLKNQEGGIFLFPVNDPDQMIFGPPDSQQKYAIVAFAPMKVDHVYDVGTETEAAIGGQSSCIANHFFAGPGATLDLENGALGTCTTPRNDIQGLVLRPAAGGAPYREGAGRDYIWAPATSTITWRNPAENVRVAFDYRSGGACPGHSFDPNAYCLELSWAGPQLIGTDPEPGDGESCLACSVRLIE